MSTFDSLFPVPTGGRNADDMGLPPAPKVEASLRAPAEVAQPDQANTVACMDSWARAQGLATYTAMGNALRDLLDMWHGGHIQVRQEASGAWHAAVQSGEAALSPEVSSHKQGDALQEARIDWPMNPQPDGGYPGCDVCTCPKGFCHQNAMHALRAQQILQMARDDIDTRFEGHLSQETLAAILSHTYKAAAKLLEAIDDQHSSKSPPHKYGIPYAAVNDLRAALAPKPQEQGDALQEAPVDESMRDLVDMPIIGAVPRKYIGDAAILALQRMAASIEIVHRVACWDHMTMFELRDLIVDRAIAATPPQAPHKDQA
jgi:hypothetical protein